MINLILSLCEYIMQTIFKIKLGINVNIEYKILIISLLTCNTPILSSVKVVSPLSFFKLFFLLFRLNTVCYQTIFKYSFRLIRKLSRPYCKYTHVQWRTKALTRPTIFLFIVHPKERCDLFSTLKWEYSFLETHRLETHLMKTLKMIDQKYFTPSNLELL